MGLYNSLCHDQIVSFLQEVLNDFIDGHPQNVEKLHLVIFGMQHIYGIAHRHQNVQRFVLFLVIKQ